MKFYLAKNATVRVNLRDMAISSYSRIEGFNASVIPIHPLKSQAGETAFLDMSRKLDEDVASRLQRTGTPNDDSNKWRLSLFINWGQAHNSKIFVGLQGRHDGSILEDLSSCFGEKVRIQIELHLAGASPLASGPELQLKTKEMPLKARQQGPGKQSDKDTIYCEDRDVKFPCSRLVSTTRMMAAIENKTTCTITVTIDEKYGAHDVVPCASIDQRILEEELFSDVVIVASNGTRIKAHKSFLATHSSVFLAMFQADMEESRKSIVQLPDMTEESVRAMLKYLYYSDIKSPEEGSLVAFELFNAGHKYNIRGLEEAMRKLLITKPADWYDVDVAVKLFLFAGNLTPVDHDLRKKAIQALQFYALEVKKSPTCQELFKKDVNAALGLLEFVLATTRRID